MQKSKNIVSHNNSFRRMWMFPRNIRRIHPWKIAQITSLLIDQTQNMQWAGNQSIQVSFTKALEAAGLKKTGVQYDANSGGARTYAAQIKSLGLIFQRNDGTVWLTKAGEDILDGKPPLPILQKLVFRYQYPSQYSLLPNVRIHPKIKVKPFLFVLKYLIDSDILFLTEEELAILVIYGHNDGCYNICKEKILKLRKGKSLVSLLEKPGEDIYTPRTRNRSIADSLTDIVDNIANTCKNYLLGVCLVEEIDINGKMAIVLSPEVKTTVEIEIANSLNFIDYQSEESFQRIYGNLNSVKDSRLLTNHTTKTINNGSNIIVAQFMKYCGQNLLLDNTNSFVEETSKDFGFSHELILKTIQPFLESSLSIYESTYLDISKGGQKTAIDFEKATCNLFGQSLHFDAKHIGQKFKAKGVGAYADILLIALDKKHCALVDTKASPRYSLSSEDHYKMIGNYIPNYSELLDGKDLKLEFCTYVAGGFQGDINKSLKAIEEKTKVPISAISSFDLLQLCKQKHPKVNQKRIRDWFANSKTLESSDYVKYM